jgi:hypothetical protein
MSQQQNQNPDQKPGQDQQGDPNWRKQQQQEEERRRQQQQGGQDKPGQGGRQNQDQERQG